MLQSQLKSFQEATWDNIKFADFCLDEKQHWSLTFKFASQQMQQKCPFRICLMTEIMLTPGALNNIWETGIKSNQIKATEPMGRDRFLKGVLSIGLSVYFGLKQNRPTVMNNHEQAQLDCVIGFICVIFFWWPRQNLYLLHVLAKEIKMDSPVSSGTSCINIQR